MKIIFFNTNDLTIDERGVIDFITQHASSTAILCFKKCLRTPKEYLKKFYPLIKKLATDLWDYSVKATKLSLSKHNLQRIPNR